MTLLSQEVLQLSNPSLQSWLCPDEEAAAEAPAVGPAPHNDGQSAVCLLTCLGACTERAWFSPAGRSSPNWGSSPNPGAPATQWGQQLEHSPASGSPYALACLPAALP